MDKIAVESVFGYVEMALRENLKRLRQDKGLTQADLADKAGVRTASISSLEKGNGDPKLSTIYKIIEALECSPDALLMDIGSQSMSGVMKTMLERAENLPDRDLEIIADIIDTYCYTNGLASVFENGRRFTIVTKAGSGKDTKVLKERAKA